MEIESFMMSVADLRRGEGGEETALRAAGPKIYTVPPQVAPASNERHGAHFRLDARAARV